MTALDELYRLTPTTQLYTHLLQCVNYVGPTSTTNMTTLSHTQIPHPRTALTAHWRISLEQGCWVVDVFNPRYSGFSTHGSYYDLGSATLVVQTWASVGDTVEVIAPDDRADGLTGVVTEYPGGQSLVSWKVA